MFRRMGNMDRQVNVIEEAKAILQSSSFIAALCVSPMVFFAAFATVRASPGDPASYLLAFQNGFFCESIFRRLFHADGTSATASASTKPRTQARRSTSPASGGGVQNSAVHTTPVNTAEEAFNTLADSQSGTAAPKEPASERRWALPTNIRDMQGRSRCQRQAGVASLHPLLTARLVPLDSDFDRLTHNPKVSPLLSREVDRAAGPTTQSRR